jgi:hypothetical protein
MSKDKTKTTTTKTGKTRKSTKGVPRVTDKIRAMDEAGKAAWLADVKGKVSATVYAEIETRLNAPKKETGAGKGRKLDFTKLFADRDMDTLLAAQTALTNEIENARIAAIEAQERILEKANKELAKLQGKTVEA